MASRRTATPRALARRLATHIRLQFQLRVELQTVKPLVWRRVLVPDYVTLPKLRVILQWTMGWTNSHLHEHEIGRRSYGIPDEDWPCDEPLIDERHVRLKSLLDTGLRRFTYLYDFGDGWEHVVSVEDLVQPKADSPLIACSAGENACPPEDVGGPHSYSEFLDILKNPNHEEHADMTNWVGGAFDPAAFSRRGEIELDQHPTWWPGVELNHRHADFQNVLNDSPENPAAAKSAS
jgi:Plasmid pRiA4b ORF-3-like protein